MISSDIPQYISSLDSNEPVVFYGRSGSGKSFYINDCVEGRKDILYFNVQSNEPNALWSLKEALNDRFGSDIGDNNYNEILACIESYIESINMIISDGLNDSHIDLVETLLNIQSSHFEDMKLIFIFDTERIGMKMLKMMSSYQIKLQEVHISDTDLEAIIRSSNPSISDENMMMCKNLSHHDGNEAKVLSWIIQYDDTIRDGNIWILERIRDYIQSQQNQMDKVQSETLDVSSVIGMTFDSNDVSNYYNANHKEIETSLFHIESDRGYIRQLKDTQYCFVTSIVRDAILSLIPDEKRVEIENKLVNYYSKLIESGGGSGAVSYMRVLLNLSWANHKDLACRTGFQLYKYYGQINDVVSQLAIIDEILSKASQESGVLQYLLFKKIELCLKTGRSDSAHESISTLRNIKSKYSSDDTTDLIDYYDVLIKYEDNLAHESFNEIIELNDKLNKKSGTLSNSGKLLRCKVFSHMASAIKNRDDDSHGEAERYYQMALKAADDLCSIDESLRFKIQRQCTMFYKEDRATRILEETADYFCRTRNMIEYSRTLLNLSTHRLFMNDTSDEVLSLFNKCEETMTGLNTREISFVYNNRSILHYFRGNYDMAIRDLNEAFKYAASDFTKFTIKSNLFNVSLKLDNGSQQRYMEDVKRISEKYSSDKDSNFMYRLYYLIDQFHFMKSSGSSIDGLEAIIRKIEKYSTSSFFISLLNGLKHSIGMDCIDVDAPYALIDRMNEDRIFLSELLFWE